MDGHQNELVAAERDRGHELTFPFCEHLGHTVPPHTLYRPGKPSYLAKLTFCANDLDAPPGGRATHSFCAHCEGL
jgi:hypothetical protein